MIEMIYILMSMLIKWEYLFIKTINYTFKICAFIIYNYTSRKRGYEPKWVVDLWREVEPSILFPLQKESQAVWL